MNTQPKPRKCMICGYSRNCLNCMANGDQHAAMFTPLTIRARHEALDRMEQLLTIARELPTPGNFRRLAVAAMRGLTL